MATQVRIDQFIQQFERVKQINLQTLKNFQGDQRLKNILADIVTFVERLTKLNEFKSEISDAALNQANSTMTQFLNQFHQLLINPNLQSIAPNLLQFEGVIKNYIEQSYAWWTQVLAVEQSKISAKDFNKIIEENRKLTDDIKKSKELSEIEAKTIENLKIELENKLNLLETRYSSNIDAAELDKQKGVFNNDADKNLRSANVWLFTIIGLVIGITIIMWILLKEFCFELNCISNDSLVKYKDICPTCPRNMLVYEILKASAFRLIVFSILIYLLKFAIKNYNVQMHQYSVNLHKRNSFEVALAFMTKSSPEAKDKIMTMAAETIFVQQKTGYISKEEVINKSSVVEKIVDKATDKL